MAGDWGWEEWQAVECCSWGGVAGCLRLRAVMVAV